MKKQGILHHELARVIAQLGHGDLLVIADAGLPVPPGVARIDLAVVGGLPAFLPVVQAILDEACVERATVAREMAEYSPDTGRGLLALLGDTPTEAIPHREFKRMTERARAIVRTGEFTPYANVILHAGVVF
jgi:D-ribose pyranase